MNPQQKPDLNVDSLLAEASSSDDEVEKNLAKFLKQDLFRRKTIQIFNEQVGTVEFMKKIQEYANEQIDTRLFKNTKVVIYTVLGWIVTIGASVIATILIT